MNIVFGLRLLMNWVCGFEDLLGFDKDVFCGVCCCEQVDGWCCFVFVLQFIVVVVDVLFIMIGVVFCVGELESGQLVVEFELWGVFMFDMWRLSFVFLVGYLLLCLVLNFWQSFLCGCSVFSVWLVFFIVCWVYEVVKKSMCD